MWFDTKAQVLAAPRWQKQILLILADLVAMAASFYIALLIWLSRSGAMDAGIQVLLYGSTIGLLYLSGFYRVVLRSFEDAQIKQVALALLMLAVFFTLLSKYRILPQLPPMLPWVYAVLVFAWLWASRSAAKVLLNRVHGQQDRKRVLIYGAGQSGRQVLALLMSTADMKVVGFVDDDPLLLGGQIAGQRIYAGADVARVIEQQKVDTVLLAMPSTPRPRRREILQQLENQHVNVLSLPGLDQLVTGKVRLSDVHSVEIADLLGREAVPPVTELLDRNIRNQVVLVTGAGGSIGSELCRQIARLHPRCLIVLELSEYALYRIHEELRRQTGLDVVPVLGSVRHHALLRQVMQRYGVNTVYHAAAYKHVPLVEANPFEGVMNNLLGTHQALRAAVESNVQQFVLISTDKAVRPTNVMGASKRLCELVCQAYAQEPGTTTTISMVRFGNVLGSSGSVVPLFREQIRQGGPVTVTHPEMTRYFMTIPEAAQLVIQAGAMAQGGDVFVLDMGEPVKILEMARKMILLSGQEIASPEQPHGIEIQFTGLRSGEKLYEELLIGGDNIGRTSHPLIMTAFEKSYGLAEMKAVIQQIETHAKTHNVDGLLTLLEQYVEDYHRSKGGVVV